MGLVQVQLGQTNLLFMRFTLLSGQSVPSTPGTTPILFYD